MKEVELAVESSFLTRKYERFYGCWAESNDGTSRQDV